MDKKNNNIIINHKLYKKMLCNNIIKENNCSYRYKCMYAHSLDEQKLEPIREYAYKLFSEPNLNHIDLNNNKELYKTLIIFTNVCNKCSTNTCQGGYNCKYGTVNTKYKICINDLTLGNCQNTKCKYVHFTNKGLKPYSNTNLYNLTINNYADTDSDESLDTYSYKTSDSDKSTYNNSIFIYNI